MYISNISQHISSALPQWDFLPTHFWGWDGGQAGPGAYHRIQTQLLVVFQGLLIHIPDRFPRLTGICRHHFVRTENLLRIPADMQNLVIVGQFWTSLNGDTYKWLQTI